MTLAPGTRLGPYEILAPLGSGVMGEVYRAQDTRLDRLVALKVLRPDIARDIQSRQRLEREARAVSRLNHPHICVLHDVGRERVPTHADELDFLVMELVHGETLSHVLARGVLPPTHVVRHGMDIASALEEAHGHSVVHGDLLDGSPAGLDLVVANLPYLADGLRTERPELAEEPPEAVFAAGDGLGPYRRLVQACQSVLRPDGYLAIQLHGNIIGTDASELSALTLAA